ncbi:putative Zinc finger, AN1-type, AN1-like Zinc finger [Plasmopara halstedii]
MQQERESAELCLNGCGFFGAPGSGAVASPRATEAKVDVATVVETAASASADIVDNNAGLQEETVEAMSTEKLVQKNKKRCWECKKKLGLTAIECRCGYIFCNSHRFEDQHNCSFDFKAADRAELARRNPGGGEFSKLEKL